MRKLVFISAVVATTACSVAIARRPNPNAVPPVISLGPPISCVPLHQLRESIVRNDRVIDFRAGGKKWYRNTLPHRCPSLAFERRFSYKTSMTSLCSSDFITVLYQYGSGLDRGASCGLGKFEPVEIVKRK